METTGSIFCIHTSLERNMVYIMLTTVVAVAIYINNIYTVSNGNLVLYKF